jgi:hypothetical protein
MEFSLFKKIKIHLWLPLLIAAAVKLWLLLSDALPFNSDEAIVALMARHIIQGETPIFFYGQAYMGSLDAILVSFGFRLFGEQVLVIRIIQVILYLGTVLTTVILAKDVIASEKAALFAGLLTAIPPVNFSLYTTVSLGGYGETLLFGNLLLLGGIKICREIRFGNLGTDRKLWFWILAWSIGAGFSFWVFGLSLVYTIPVGLLLFLEIAKTKQSRFLISVSLIAILGICLGASLWLAYAYYEGGNVVLEELLGGAIAQTKSNLILLQPIKQLGSALVFGGTVLLGLRPPWSVRWLMMPLLPFVLIFWMAVLIASFRKIIEDKKNTEWLMIGLVGLVLLLGFIFTPYGGDPSGRYFLPLMVPMAIFGAELLEKGLSDRSVYQYGMLFVILIFQFGGNYQAVKANPPGLTTQFDQVAQIDHEKMDELIRFLVQVGEPTGYSNYWVSYPLAFLSEGKLIYTPRLPYHEDFRYTARDDRYHPYSDIVEKADKAAYITTHHQALDEYLEWQFEDHGVDWKKKQIGDYHIYYDLSRKIRPQEIGLGITTQP